MSNLDKAEGLETMSDTEKYLGDAVYASFDGYQIWLRTGDGNDNRIALEPAVFKALVEYHSELSARIYRGIDT